jgi:hypothetical protein
MAQTGFTPISLYYTATAAATPTAGNLVAGELAINTNDGKLFYKDSSGVVQTIATKASAALGGSTTGTGALVLQTSPTVTTPTIDKINTSVANTSLGAGNASIMKNRIINGAMVIDQRNAGASFAQTNGAFNLDRYFGYSYTGSATTGKYTVQQNAGSVTPPVGFANYLGVTSTATTSTNAGDIYMISQRIEGYNIADLNFGTANAKTITLSFWVRSSATGTFGGSIGNGDVRTYPFTYTISAANTWEQKSITIAGDTGGTWLTTNGRGMDVVFQLQIGSTFTTSPNAWTSSFYYGANGCVNLLNNNGATWYMTGLQLEVGSSATGFEYVNYQTSLANCQRYYYVHNGTFVNPSSSVITPVGIASQESSTLAITAVPFKINMRSAPTLISTSGTDYYRFARAGGTDYFNSFTLDSTNTTIATIYNDSDISGTAGWAGRMLTNSTSASVAFNAEL